VNLSAGQQEDNTTAQNQKEENDNWQAARPPGDDTPTVLPAPEFDLDADDELVVNATSYY